MYIRLLSSMVMLCCSNIAATENKVVQGPQGAQLSRQLSQLNLIGVEKYTEAQQSKAAYSLAFLDTALHMGGDVDHVERKKQWEALKRTPLGNEKDRACYVMKRLHDTLAHCLKDFRTIGQDDFDHAKAALSQTAELSRNLVRKHVQVAQGVWKLLGGPDTFSLDETQIKTSDEKVSSVPKNDKDATVLQVLKESNTLLDGHIKDCDSFVASDVQNAMTQDGSIVDNGMIVVRYNLVAAREVVGILREHDRFKVLSDDEVSKVFVDWRKNTVKSKGLQALPEGDETVEDAV